MTDQIEIDGHTYELGEWEVRSGIGVPDSLTAEISKGPALTPACPPFTFGGSTWHLTGLTVSNNTSAGSLTMKLEATTKTVPYAPKVPPRTALPPKSRLRLPSVPKASADPHEHCVPIEHYTELMAFVAHILLEEHDGYVLVPDADIEQWRDWRVLHSKEGGLHTFLAVDPSVVIDHDAEMPF